MRKNEVLSLFGEKKSKQVLKMSQALGIKREAIYQWGEEIPELRAYQIERLLREGVLPIRGDAFPSEGEAEEGAK